ncbi:Fe-Mn family superoxide dismutase [Candidatus Ishikawella capsulata]|uniref:Superoxide dismutase n=1 Tax=Candidatus Ishikawaella capsulata Mpkobe TaxID=476281 RepID=C5WC40_9ENTR|nr:Fe-Mn family superoxide dismutase [Candidatus Ishikawaella capsulata]BAH82896.1 superoxide dismutase(Mn) [Candidatus Ishikawaella capsulata Mpkobe]
MSYSLPSLSYPYDSLEPYLDTRTMEIHHTKHHQTYINNANMALKGTVFDNLTAYELITNLDKIHQDKKTFLRNNIGGHVNHSIFWKLLKKGTSLKNELQIAIKDNFGSIEEFKEKFELLASSHFGSGWIWLINKNDKLFLTSTNNQDNPLMGENIIGISGYPIFGLDVWEHAYYLKYQNRRLDYIKAFWNVINWDEANKRFLSK